MRDQLKSLTNMVNVMNQQQVCDADCQNKKNIENLRKTYVMAQQNVQNSKPNLERAEKDYITASQGAQVYSKMQEKKYKKIAQDAVSEYNKDVEDKLLAVSYTHLTLPTKRIV